MKLAVIGGQLQGTEATYLAKQAGYEVLLIDRNPHVPASTLADEFVVADAVRDYDEVSSLLKSADLIVPANENGITLSVLCQMARKIDRPLAFDPDSYAISSSKNISNTFFHVHDTPLPALWPNCKFPVIIKPSDMSGSAGVKRIDSEEDLRRFLQKKGGAGSNLIIQEYIPGPSLSIEVVAYKGQSRTLQVTELEFDSNFDCKRVLAGIAIDHRVEAELRKIGCDLAKALNLTGIMDVEVMVDNKIPKVIEIDARLPSQTPTAVLHSSGINMMTLLAEIFGTGKVPPLGRSFERAVIYEHAFVSGDRLEITGEHVMATAGPLSCKENVYGFDRIITDFTGKERAWAITLISSGATVSEVKSKHQKAIAKLMVEHNLKTFIDPVPTTG